MARAISERFGGTVRDEVVAKASSPAYQAYQVLHVAFVAAPVIAGLDKFTRILTDWDRYVAPLVASMLPFSARTFMMIVGVIEIAAALLVAVKPRVGSWVVGAWLFGIIVNLLLTGQYFDIALRDFGLMLGALALNRLSVDFDTKAPRVHRA